MSEYRVRETGDIKSQEELLLEHAKVSLPKRWGANVYDALGIDPVIAVPAPEPSGKYKQVVRKGVIQDTNGNWVYAWTEKNMFKKCSRHIDADGNEVLGKDHKNYNKTISVTKAKQEAEYKTKMDTESAAQVREMRNKLLAETDFYALSDVTMSDEMSAYRQALRDITIHPKFPSNLLGTDWPLKP